MIHNIALNERGERLEIEIDAHDVTLRLIDINREAEVTALPQFAAVAGRLLLLGAGERIPPDLTAFPIETRSPEQIEREDYPASVPAKSFSSPYLEETRHPEAYNVSFLLRMGKRSGWGVRSSGMEFSRITLESWAPATDEEHSVPIPRARAFANAILAICDEADREASAAKRAAATAKNKDDRT